MVTVFLSAALGSPLLETDIDQLSIFRFYSHPELAPKIEAMKGELTTYLDLIADIKPLEQRRKTPRRKRTPSTCSSGGARRRPRSRRAE